MTMLTDIHTHNIPFTQGAALYNLPLLIDDIPVDQPCSVGLHPWQIDSEWEKSLAWVVSVAGRESVLAVGEAGLDRLRGPSLELQETVFKAQVSLGEMLRKPLIVHNVRCGGQLLRLHRDLSPSMPWVVHGFRGNSLQAASFADQGIWMSFGLRFDPQALRTVGLNKLLIETDEYPDLTDVVNNISAVLNVPATEVLTVASNNAARFLGIDFEP